MSEYQILQPTPHDIDALAAFYRECRVHSDMALLPDYFQSIPMSLYYDVWSDHFAHPDLNRAGIVWHEGKRVGFYRAGERDDYDATPLSTSRTLDLSTCGELHQIYLLPTHQKHGLGRQLYQRAMNDLKELGYKTSLVCTYYVNTPARNFYERMGATHVLDTVYHLNFPPKIWDVPVSIYAQPTNSLPGLPPSPSPPTLAP